MKLINKAIYYCIYCKEAWFEEDFRELDYPFSCPVCDNITAEHGHLEMDIVPWWTKTTITQLWRE